VEEMYLDSFAEVFATAGLNALVFDNRNFGASDGEPRQEIDPWQQVRDDRHAITYACTLDQQSVLNREFPNPETVLLDGDDGALSSDSAANERTVRMMRARSSVRRPPRRSRMTLGFGAPVNARSVPKSVSAVTMTRFSCAARESNASSVAPRRPISATWSASWPASPRARARPC
jgi:hypothetical protein